MSIPDHIDAIKDRYEDFWSNAEALKEAVAVWNAEGHVNDCGVFAGYEREVVAKSNRAVAEVGVYKARDGVYVHCSHFMSATEGFGYAPSVWCSEPHETAEKARAAGIAELLGRIRDRGTGGEKAENEDRRQIRRQLQGLVKQPTLF
jgi:hypothetical protein